MLAIPRGIGARPGVTRLIYTTIRDQRLGGIFMHSDQERQVVSFVSGLILGSIIGAGVALLTAPQPGHKTRKRVRKTARRLQGTATDRLDDLATDLKGRVDDAVGIARARLP